MSEEVKEAIMQFQTAIDFKTATVMPMEYSIDIENAKVLLKYIEQLQQENEELKKYCCKRNDCGGRLKENHKPTDNEVLTEFEKWLEEETKCTEQYADNDMAKGYINAIKLCKYYLQELKEGKK